MRAAQVLKVHATVAVINETTGSTNIDLLRVKQFQFQASTYKAAYILYHQRGSF